MWSWLTSRVVLTAPARALRPVSVFAAVLVATVVLGLTGGAGPLFVGSASSASISNQLAARNADDLGVQVFGDPGQRASNEQTVTRLTRDLPSLGPIHVTDLASGRDTTMTAGSQSYPTTVVYRPGAAAHVTVLQDAGGDGVLVADDFAKPMGLKPGDTMELDTGGSPVRVRVAGIFRNINEEPHRAYWGSTVLNVYGKGVLDEYPPPVLTVVRGAALGERLATTLPMEELYSRPLAGPVTLPTAQRVLAGEKRVRSTLGQTPRRFVVGPSGRVSPAGLRLAQSASGDTVAELAYMVSRAGATGESLSGASAAIAGAGSALALLLVAGCGVLWADRRRAETRLLAARGVGAAGLATMALGEMLPAALLGTGLGWLLARFVVPAIGPSSLLPAAQVLASAQRTGYVAAAAVAVLLLATTSAVRRAADPVATAAGRRRARVLRAIPVELAVLGAAWWTYHLAARQGLATLSDTGIPRIRAVDLLFPILAVIGFGALVARIVVLAVVVRRRRSDGGRPASYLAARRLAGAPQVPAVLVTSAALAFGVLAFAITITTTLSYTVTAKTKVYVGASAVASFVDPPKQLPASLLPISTKVTRAEDLQTSTGPHVDVIAVDPATFARGAFWDDRFASRSLPSLLADLTAPAGGGGTGVPAIVTGGGLPASFAVDFPAPDGQRVRLPVTVTGRSDVFPSRNSRPLVVIARSALPAPAAAFAESELWMRDFGPAQVAALSDSGAEVRDVLTVADVSQVPTIAVITWAYGFFEALGIVSGVIALGGLLLYLATRQRSRAIAYGLARRMGLRRRAHWWSLVLEISAGLVIGCGAGIVCALASAWVIHGHLDPQPSLPPGPLFEAPWATVGVLAAVAVVATLLAASVGQRQADRASTAQLMRFGA